MQLAFAALVIRACGDFAVSLAHAGDHLNATKYNTTAVRLAAVLKARPSSHGGAWHEDYGVHAAAYAINAKILATPDEVPPLCAALRPFMQNSSGELCAGASTCEARAK